MDLYAKHQLTHAGSIAVSQLLFHTIQPCLQALFHHRRFIVAGCQDQDQQHHGRYIHQSFHKHYFEG